MSTWVVVLAGGVGSRFWPLSTPSRPKQFLPLVDEKPLLADTLERMAPLADAAHTLILTSGNLASGVANIAPSLPRENIVVEPRPAGTAGALAWAADIIARRDDRDAVMISVHADWAVADADRFRDTLRQAADLASARHLLVTVGVVPVRPDPGLGYICPGEPLGNGAFRVARFTEKPDRARAAVMIREGCLWNSGIFAWCVGDLLDEVKSRTPEVSQALDGAAGNVQQYFALVRNVSVDVGVLERSERVAVIPGDFGWDDVGTWAALRRVRALDHAGNATFGAVHAIESNGNVILAEGGTVVVFGVSDLVVVAQGDLTLVTTTERALDLKELVEALPSDVGRRP